MAYRVITRNYYSKKIGVIKRLNGFHHNVGEDKTYGQHGVYLKKNCFV